MLNPRRILLVIAAFGAALPAAAVAPEKSARSLTVGALLPLTGEFASYGATGRAALEIARNEVNASYHAAGSAFRVRLHFEDTVLDPEIALRRLRTLHRRGVRDAIGPVTSAELARIRSFAQRNGVLLLSYSSTAGSLALPGDSVFRFCPSDASQGDAIAALMELDGVGRVVPIWRGDVGNDGIVASVRRALGERGAALDPGTRYEADSPDLDAALAELSRQVDRAVDESGQERVAVFLSGFEEGIQVLRRASTDPELAAVRWYGSDGIVASPALPADPVAAAFAARAGFPSPEPGLDPAAAAKWGPLQEAIRARSGFTPDSFTLAACDALWVAALSRSRLGRAPSLRARTTSLVQTAARFWGATGWTLLDAAGDRAIATYDFLAVREAESGFEWRVVARFAGGRIQRVE